VDLELTPMALELRGESALIELRGRPHHLSRPSGGQKLIGAQRRIVLVVVLAAGVCAPISGAP